MRIYTKTGDRGETSLIGGKRVPKYHERIDAYGTIDELISYIGLIRDQPVNEKYIKTLIHIQDKLMACAAILAADCEDCNVEIPEIKKTDISDLEKEIDVLSETLEPLSSFILPGGHTIVSYCHIARCVCRRAERITLKLKQNFFVPDNLMVYLNRLSDYLFALSRRLSADLQCVEIKWQSKL